MPRKEPRSCLHTLRVRPRTEASCSEAVVQRLDRGSAPNHQPPERCQPIAKVTVVLTAPGEQCKALCGSTAPHCPADSGLPRKGLHCTSAFHPQPPAPRILSLPALDANSQPMMLWFWSRKKEVGSSHPWWTHQVSKEAEATGACSGVPGYRRFASHKWPQPQLHWPSW